MAQLAIKGHPTKGKEVIEILEMLGGKIRRDRLAGNEVFSWYYINGNGYIDYKHYSLFHDTTCFSLEKFLEIFPYKVGDKVQHKGAPSCGSVFEIEKMRWEENTVRYTLRLFGCNYKTSTLSAEYLQPYKEETIDKAVFDANAQCCDIMNHLIKKETMEENLKQIILEIPDGYEFFGINNDNKVVLTKKQPKYPKTYDECVNMFNCTVETANLETLKALRELIYCRNTYWEIAGEQMGLGKPWKPDWNKSKPKHTIVVVENELVKCFALTQNFILAFPTEKMRDAFYEYFKELIKQCKELL